MSDSVGNRGQASVVLLALGQVAGRGAATGATGHYGRRDEGMLEDSPGIPVRQEARIEHGSKPFDDAAAAHLGDAAECEQSTPGAFVISPGQSRGEGNVARGGLPSGHRADAE